ncbi:MAG: hypothetical protein PVF59_08390, partial [Desulfobacterales bacterium]
LHSGRSPARGRPKPPGLSAANDKIRFAASSRDLVSVLVGNVDEGAAGDTQIPNRFDQGHILDVTGALAC